MRDEADRTQSKKFIELQAENDELRKAQEELEALRDKYSEHKRTEVALRESEELHRITLGSISDAVFITDDYGVFTYICPNVDVIFGYTVQEVQTLGNIAKLLGDGLFDPNELATLGEIQNIECEVTDKAGRRHILLVHVKHVSIKTGTVLYTCRDITERKWAEEALQRSGKRYRRLLEAVTDYTYSVKIEHDQKITTHSSGCVAVTGYTSQEYEADPNLWYRMIYESDREAVMEQLARVLAGEDVAPFEHRIIHKDGTIRWLKNTWVPRHVEHGCLVAYDGLIQDVTERKHVEEVLAEERNLLRTLIDNLPDYVYVKDVKSRFLLANDAVRRHLGAATVEEIVGKTDLDFSPPELAEQYYADERMLFSSGQPLVGYEEPIFDYETKTKRWVLTTKVPFRDSQGKIVGLVGMNRDITELRQAQEAYQMLVEHSLQGLAIFQEARIVFANPALVQISGYTVDELISFSPKQVKALVHPEDQALVWVSLRDHFAGKPAPPRLEARLICKDGVMRWIETYANRTEYRGKLAVQVAVIDITEQVQAVEALRESEARLDGIISTAIDAIITIERAVKPVWPKHRTCWV